MRLISKKFFWAFWKALRLRSVKSGMLRESGRRDPYGRGVSNRFSKLSLKRQKRQNMEIVNTIYDLGIVLAFLGIAMTPGAIGTYFALREEE